MTRQSRLIHETPKNKNDTLFADSGGMRSTEYLHPLAKTRRRPAFSGTAKEQSSNDSPKKRNRDRLWNHWVQREERCALSRFPKIVKTVCGQARHWDRLGAGSRVERAEPRREKDLVALRTCEPAQLNRQRLRYFIPVARRARVCQADVRANAEHFHPRQARN